MMNCYIAQFITLANYVCVTCQKETGGAHSCKTCLGACHAIPLCSVRTGDEDDEGYGASVICLNCFKGTVRYIFK